MMTGLNDYACEGTLTIGGVSMNRLAWACLGDESGRGGLITMLTGVEQRGEDRIIPSVTGVIAYPRRLTKVSHELRILVVGDVDLNGSNTADPLVGLVANLDYLYTNVVAPVVSTTGTRAATVDWPGLATRSADIHVLALTSTKYVLVDQRPAWEGMLRISIPAGRFV